MRRKARVRQPQWRDGVNLIIRESPWASSSERGRISDVYFKNITIYDDSGKGYENVVKGYDDRHLIENVTLENLVFLDHPIHNAEEGRFGPTDGVKNYIIALPRTARGEYPGLAHQVAARAFGDRKRFGDDEDRNACLSLMPQRIAESGVRCYDWSLIGDLVTTFS